MCVCVCEYVSIYNYNMYAYIHLLPVYFMNYYIIRVYVIEQPIHYTGSI